MICFSGDLAYLSCVAREYFQKVGQDYDIPYFGQLLIMASNDINEETILSLNEQVHCIDSFGIGTHLVSGNVGFSLVLRDLWYNKTSKIPIFP